MKRIFLTSGLVLCMACPAFAEGNGFGSTEAGTLSGACVEPRLGTYSGSSELKAIWNPVSGTVTLDDNYYYNGAGTSTYSATKNATPDPLYTVFGNADGTFGAGVYSDSGHVTSVTQLTDLPELTGYTFGGFSSTKTGTSGVLYVSNEGEVDPSLADFGDGTGGTLYAQWTPKEYTVSYNVGSIPGSTTSLSAPEPQKVTFDLGPSGQTLTFATPLEADGYTFAGWKTSANLETGVPGDTTYGNATSGGSISAYKYDGNPTLTAQWTANTYTVAYDCGDGSLIPGNTFENGTVTFNGSYTFATNSDNEGCYMKGHHFVKWSCDNGVGDHSTSCNNHTCQGDTVSNWTYTGIANGTTVTCTAQYDANTIGLTWDANGGEVETAGGESCSYGGSILLPENPSRTGYEFGGWEVKSVSGESGLSVGEEQ